ncbi:hypothetical protein [Staphylococcus ratti]|uniref:Uncharacterized protein n=1 Tax=Staphylococcus ratti TaxID=2892440 RepID=A0ABY3PEF6_9STAP|nr:hypothetical protein [Staphylococcus ratti]UEX90619.1 hypothetical protein LN051_02840 [Staphylococcus ratti]
MNQLQLIIPAFLCIGLALGILVDKTGVGLFMGLGLGLLTYAQLKTKYTNKG